MSLEYLLLFSATVFLASIIPGPSMLLALTHGINYGAKKTTASALGNVSVTLIQASISIAGLGAVLLASETIFLLIKWSGAIYLVYMGISIFFARDFGMPAEDAASREIQGQYKKLFVQAAAVTAGNPKAIVFFTAVFPQFIDPGAIQIWQAAYLLGICAIIAFACFMIYAICGQKISALFSRAKSTKYFKRAIGGTFIGAGLGLAASDS